MTALSMQALSGGRFIIGFGTSGPQVIEGWHGIPFAHIHRADLPGHRGGELTLCVLSPRSTTARAG